MSHDSDTCRKFYTITRELMQTRTLKAFAGSAVLGDETAYTVELKDGTQIEVGRAHCKWCARHEALSKLADKIEGPVS
jgi:16S rRNA G966 N2-methylase RsmD